ncbi:MAG: CHAT domain-containing protein [Bacteroidota bacterium]
MSLGKSEYSQRQNNLYLHADQLIREREYVRATEEYQELLSSNRLKGEGLHHAQLQLLRLQLQNRTVPDSALVDEVEEAFQKGELSQQDRVLYYLVKAKLEVLNRNGIQAISLLEIAEEKAASLYDSNALIQLEILTLLGETTYLYDKRPDLLTSVLHYLEEADKLLLKHPEWSFHAQDHYLWKANMSFINRDVDFSSLDLAVEMMERQPDGIDHAFLARCASVRGRLFKHSAYYDLQSVGHHTTEALEMVRKYPVDEITRQTVYRDYLTYCARLEDSTLFLNTLDELKARLKGNVKYVSPTRLEAFRYKKIKDKKRAAETYELLLQELDRGEHFYNITKLYDEANYALGAIYRGLKDFDRSDKHYMNILLIGMNEYGQEYWEFEELLDEELRENNPFAFFAYANLAKNQLKRYEQNQELQHLEKAAKLFKSTDEQCFNYLFTASNNTSLNLIGELPRQYYSEAIETHLHLYKSDQQEAHLWDANYYIERMKSFLLQRELFVIDKEGEEDLLGLDFAKKQRAIRKDIHALWWEKTHTRAEVDQQIQQLKAQYNLNSDRAGKSYSSYVVDQEIYNQQLFSELKDWVKKDTINTVIQYAISSDEVYILLDRYDRKVLKKVKFDDENSGKSIDSLINRYIDILKKSDPGSEYDPKTERAALSYQLFQTLVEPIYDLVPKNSRVLIVQDTKISDLPFTSLLTKCVENPEQIDYTEAPFLLHDWMIHAAPSLKTFSSVKDNFLTQHPKVLAFSVANPSSKFQWFGRESGQGVLTEGGKEVELLCNVYKEESICFYGSDMNLKNFNEHIQLPYDIIHISAHANADSIHYSNNRISFYKEGEFLYGHQISSLALKNRPLVVLSACETGIGVKKSTGAFSFSRSFLEAGADKVIATLWTVSDKSSSEILQDFYQNLSQSGDVVRSLWEAQKKYVLEREEGEEHFAHPKYWAGISCWE